jgi:hypothetical protein
VQNCFGAQSRLCRGRVRKAFSNFECPLWQHNCVASYGSSGRSVDFPTEYNAEQTVTPSCLIGAELKILGHMCWVLQLASRYYRRVWADVGTNVSSAYLGYVTHIWVFLAGSY